MVQADTQAAPARVNQSRIAVGERALLRAPASPQTGDQGCNREQTSDPRQKCQGTYELLLSTTPFTTYMPTRDYMRTVQYSSTFTHQGVTFPRHRVIAAYTLSYSYYPWA